MTSVKLKPTKRGTNLKKLTIKERLFVEAFPIDFNLTNAAKAAKYAYPNVMGSKLLAKPHIQRALGKILNQRISESRLEARRVLQELVYLALRDPIDLCDENGKICVDDLRKVPERIRRCIDSLKVKQTKDPETGEVSQTIELKLTSKHAAVELAMKHLGLLAPEKIDVLQKVSLDWDKLCGRGNNREERLALEDKLGE